MNSDDRIQDLEAKVAELTALVEQMTAPQSATPTLIETTGIETTVIEAAEAEVPKTASRRGMLKLAGAAAVGAVAATATGALPAAATNGINIVDPALPVRNDYTGNASTAAFLFQAGSTYGNASASYPCALAGWSESTVTKNGIYGYSNTGGYGSIGVGLGSGGIGLLATGTAANIHLTNSGAAPSARTDAHVLGEVVCDTDGDVWICTVAGTPGTWRKVAGAATSGSLHLLATPKRVYDSRAGQLPDIAPKTPLSGATRTIDCTLNSSGVPARAAGLVLNVTASAISANGYLSVSPGTSGFSGTSTLNWGSAGAVVANSVTVSTGPLPPARIDVTAGGGGNADFIVDVFGYYL